MLAMILPGIDNKAIPLQFEQSERSPFLAMELSHCLSNRPIMFLAAYTQISLPFSRFLSGNLGDSLHKPCLLMLHVYIDF